MIEINNHLNPKDLKNLFLTLCVNRFTLSNNSYQKPMKLPKHPNCIQPKESLNLKKSVLSPTSILTTQVFRHFHQLLFRFPCLITQVNDRILIDL